MRSQANIKATKPVTLCKHHHHHVHGVQGAKIGILGANGAGKSSLMRILAGVDTAFEGNLNLVPGIRIGYLEQVGPSGRHPTGRSYMSTLTPAWLNCNFDSRHDAVMQQLRC